MKSFFRTTLLILLSLAVVFMTMYAVDAFNLIDGNKLEAGMGGYAVEDSSGSEEQEYIEAVVNPIGLEGSLHYLDLARSGEDAYYYSECVRPETLEHIDHEITALAEEGNEVGFVLFDLKSGNAITYNSERKFYPASTVKAHYAVSLTAERPDVFETYHDLIGALLIYSDNGAYQFLADTYGMEYYQKWCENVGVDSAIAADMYIDTTPMESARLWAENYYWFRGDDNGNALGELFETPEVSLFHQLVDEDTKTRTKAGWYGSYIQEECATNDCGIIYEQNNPYIVILFTDLPQDFEALADLAEALMEAHQDLVEVG